jgi:autotransporter-associated beta strand protein
LETTQTGTVSFIQISASNVTATVNSDIYVGGTGSILLGSGNLGTVLNSTLNLGGQIKGTNATTAEALILSSGSGTGGVVNLTSTGSIIDGSKAGGKVTITGNGVVNIQTSANTYTGLTIIGSASTSPTVSVLSLNRVIGGTASSSLGTPSSAANGLIALGSGVNSGTLIYKGTGESTDRVIDLKGTTGGATLDQSGSGALKFETAFTATGAGIKTLTLQGSSTGTGEIAGAIVNGSGTTSLTKAGTGTWTLSGVNAYTGGTSLNAGTLQLGNASGLGSSGTISFGGGTLQYGAGITTDLSSRFSSAASQAYNIDTNGNNVALASALTSSGGSLTKTGTGTLTLSSANAYTGATTVSAGTLALGASASLASTSINNNSTFDVSAVSGGYHLTTGKTLSGNGVYTGAVTIDSGAILAPGNSPGTATFNSALTLSGTTIMEIAGKATAGTDYDQIVMGPGATLTYGGTLSLVEFGGYNLAQVGSYTLFSSANIAATHFSSVSLSSAVLGSPLGLVDASNNGIWSGTDGAYTVTFTENNGVLVVTGGAVPEPSTYAMFAGLGALGMAAWRRRRAAAS